MGKTLPEIAQQLSTPKTVQRTVPEKTKVIEEAKPVPKVQLIYAFNGTGKTRLSREFKQLIAPKADGDEGDEATGHDAEEAREAEDVEEEEEDESYFSDKNRWRRGGILDPDANEW